MNNNEEMIIQDHLYSQNCLFREKAAAFLSGTNSAGVAERLISEFTHRDRFVALRAAWGLTLMKEKLSLPPLIKALRSSTPEVCRQGAWALNRIKSSRAEKALAAALNDRNPAVQKEASSALYGKAIAKTLKVQKALIKMLQSDKGCATITLGHTKTRQAMDALAAALKIRAYNSRAMAILALARAKDNRAFEPAVGMLKAKNHDQCTAMWALRLLDDTATLAPVVDHITHLGRDEGYNTLNNSLKTVDALKRTAAAESLLPFLRSKDYKVRLSGVTALGAVAPEKSTIPLIRMLGDAHWLVRGSVAEALGKTGDARAVKHLVRSLGDNSWYVRRHAAFALGRLKDPGAACSLLTAFKDKSEIVRLAAAQALSEISIPKIINEMIRGLMDNNPFIRRASAEALGKMKARKAVPALLTRLTTGQDLDIGPAIEALGNIGDRRAIEALERCLRNNNAEIYLAAEKALKQINEPKPTVFRHTYRCGIR